METEQRFLVEQEIDGDRTELGDSWKGTAAFRRHTEGGLEPVSC